MNQYKDNFFSVNKVKEINLYQEEIYLLPESDLNKIVKTIQDNLNICKTNISNKETEVYNKKKELVAKLESLVSNKSFFDKILKSKRLAQIKELEIKIRSLEDIFYSLEKDKKDYENKIKDSSFIKDSYQFEHQNELYRFIKTPVSLIDLKEYIKTLYVLSITLDNDDIILYYFLSATDRIVFIKENFSEIKYLKATNKLFMVF